MRITRFCIHYLTKEGKGDKIYLSRSISTILKSPILNLSLRINHLREMH